MKRDDSMNAVFRQMDKRLRVGESLKPRRTHNIASDGVRKVAFARISHLEDPRHPGRIFCGQRGVMASPDRQCDGNCGSCPSFAPTARKFPEKGCMGICKKCLAMVDRHLDDFPG